MEVVHDELVIEVTRRCNMGCAHCMRGEAQDVDIPFEVIDKALENVTQINSLIFTGGEPTLNVPAIRHTLEVCEENGIFVNSFYVVTNGKSVPTDFLTVLIDWYAYVAKNGGELDMCSVALSSDIFHEDIDTRNVQKLQALSFFNREDKKTDWDTATMLNLGRARSLNDYKCRDVRDSFIDIEQDGDVFRVNEGYVTITVNGEYLCNCDYEYENTEHLKIGSVDDPNWVLEAIKVV